MVINCGVCDNKISTHVIDVKHGHHYNEHYEVEEHILHPDLGKILEIGITEMLNKRLDEIQQRTESQIVKSAFHKVFIESGCGLRHESISDWSNSIKDVKGLITHLESVIKQANDNKIVIESGVIDNSLFKPTKFGRHYNHHWNRLHIPKIDVCAKCFKWFNKETMSLDSLNTLIPKLGLVTLNEDIWDDIKDCEVKIELKDW